MKVEVQTRGLLLEREGELAQADAVLEEAVAGRGAALVVVGPAGIGKTRLLEEIFELGSRRELEVHRARGDELETRFAYGLVRQLLGLSVQRLKGTARASVLRGPAQLAVSVLEASGAAASGDWRDEGQEGSIAYSLYWLVHGLAEVRPRLFCVDDIQWGDQASLRFLDFLVRRLEELPVVVALSCRTPGDLATAEALVRLGSVSRARRLPLRALSEPGVAKLAAHALGSDPSSRFSQQLWRATLGNPFLVRELLAEGGITSVIEGSTQLEVLVPESVVQFALRRLGPPDGAPAKLARAVAVLSEARLGDAAALADLPETEAAAVADRLATAEIFAPGTRLRFVHPLLREAIYSSIGEAECSLAHARAARVLADSGAPIEQIAAQLLKALPRGQAWVVKTLLDAAELALRRGSPDDAVVLMARAFAEPPPPELRSRVALELGKAQAHAEHPDAVETLRQALALAAGPTERARAALQLVRTLGMYSDNPAALALLDEQASWGEGVEPELALQLEAELLGFARLQADTRPEALARLDRLAPRARPPRRSTVVLLANLALAALERNDPPETVAELATFALTGNWLLSDETFQFAYAVCALMWVDRLEEAWAACDAAVEAARGGGSLKLAVLAHALRSQVNLRLGRVADAVADAHISHELMGDNRFFRSAPFGRAHLGNVLMVEGAWDEAAAALGHPDPREHAEEIPAYLDSRGRLHLGRSDPASALADFTACGEALARRGGRDSPSIIPWRSHAALALLQLGDDRRAHELAREELQLATAAGVAGSVGESLITLGLIEGGEGGIARLRQAVEILKETPRVLSRARALTELGAMLRRERRPLAARPCLAEALDLSHRSGASALADRARAELLAAGGRPRRSARTGREALTASEQRVIELATQGLTNRQIAQALFVSMRTVTTHLTHAYQKLGITSREELSPAQAAAAVANGAQVEKTVATERSPARS